SAISGSRENARRGDHSGSIRTIYFPLLTTRLTFAPWLRRLPGFGFCPITWPFLIAREVAWVILPTEQWRDLSACVAAATVLPFSFGTVHLASGANVAVTVVSAPSVT